MKPHTMSVLLGNLKGASSLSFLGLFVQAPAEKLWGRRNPLPTSVLLSHTDIHKIESAGQVFLKTSFI